MTYQDAIEDSDIIDGLDLKFLKFFGLWRVINDYRTTGKRNRILKFSALTAFILVIPYITFQCMSYFKIKVDIQKATFLNLNTFFAFQLCCRMFIFWYKIGSQCTLANLLKKNFLNIPEGKRTAVDEIYKKISKISNACCTTYMISNIFIVLLLVGKPDTSVDYILYHTGNMDDVTTGRKKIFGGWYPLPMDRFPYYEIIFVYETICSVWAGLFLVVYFSLFFQVLVCLYGQFIVLGFLMETMEIDDGLHKDEAFKIILKDHQNLLRYSEELRSVYNPLVTMTLGMGVLVLIIGTLQFMLEKASLTFIIKIFEVFMFQGFEVCLFCFSSSFLETASSDLQFAAYSSEWYKADKPFGNALQILMVSAQRGVRLSAIRMYPVNRETLMSILQFTYSTSTVMLRMTEQK